MPGNETSRGIPKRSHLHPAPSGAQDEGPSKNSFSRRSSGSDTYYNTLRTSKPGWCPEMRPPGACIPKRSNLHLAPNGAQDEGPSKKSFSARLSRGSDTYYNTLRTSKPGWYPEMRPPGASRNVQTCIWRHVGLRMRTLPKKASPSVCREDQKKLLRPCVERIRYVL